MSPPINFTSCPGHLSCMERAMTGVAKIANQRSIISCCLGRTARWHTWQHIEMALSLCEGYMSFADALISFFGG